METTALNPHAIAVMALTFIALVLFSRDRIPIETSSLFVIVALCLGFSFFPFLESGKEIDPANFFLGFSNEALIAISALMVASESLVRTGALTPFGRLIARHWATAPRLSFLLMLILTAVISAFMNNTPQVVLMIPILVSVALRSGQPASGMLMPMTFAAQIGGMATPIGTSLNLLVIASAASLGVRTFGMFDFALPALLAGTVGMIYLWLIAPRLIPYREPNMKDTSPRLFNAQLNITEGSVADGKTVADVMKEIDGAKITRIERDGLVLMPLPDALLKVGDRLFLRDTSERLKEIEQALKGVLYAGAVPIDAEHPLLEQDQQLAELVVTAHSPLDGRTLAQTSFDERYRLTPMAHHRGNEQQTTADLDRIPLRVGDVLLVQGHKDDLQEVRRNSELLVLDATIALPHTSKAKLSLAIMGGIVLISSLKLLPVAESALLGVLVMIVTGCLTWRSATRALDSQMILLTVASIALSYAMVHTGGATYLAKQFGLLVAGLPGTWIVSLLILFAALMSNIVSNSAAAVIGTPIAVKLAQQLGYSPEPFVLAMLFGVNMAYSTPMADNCNLMVYSAGNYKFTDFLRAGIPLTVVMWLAYSVLLPIFFPL